MLPNGRSILNTNKYNVVKHWQRKKRTVPLSLPSQKYFMSFNSGPYKI